MEWVSVENKRTLFGIAKTSKPIRHKLKKRIASHTPNLYTHKKLACERQTFVLAHRSRKKKTGLDIFQTFGLVLEIWRMEKWKNFVQS